MISQVQSPYEIELVGKQAFEYPPLHTRIPETLAAEAARDASRVFVPDRTNVIITQRPNTLRAVIERSGAKRKGKIRFQFHSDLFIASPDEIKFADLPFINIHNLIVCEAEALDESDFNALKSICIGSITCTGLMATKRSWFFRWARSETVKRVATKASKVCAIWPDQIEYVDELKLEMSESEQQRYLDLEDVDVIEDRDLEAFASRRLSVLTDRPEHLLSKRQREYTEPGEKSNIVPFEMTELQRYYRAEKAKAPHKRVLLLKYRRGGFTTLEQAESYQLVATRPYAQCATLAHTFEATKRIFRIAKTFHDQDPRAPILKSDSMTSLEFARMNSSFIIGTAGGRGFARGDTLQRVHGSEVAWWCDGNADAVQKLISAITGAASHGEIVLETTPNGHEHFYSLYDEAKKGLNNWTPIFLPWFVDPINRLTIPVDRDDWSDSEINLEDMAWRKHNRKIDGFQIAFRRLMQKEHKKLFPQEYPEDDLSCFLSTGTAFFDLDRVTEISGLCRPHIKSEHVPGGKRVTWEKPDGGVKYVIGADTSEGLAGGDPNGLTIMRRDTGAIVCTVHGRFRPNVLAKHCVAMSALYNRALVGIERNNHGHSVIQTVEEIGGGYFAHSQHKGGALYYHSDGKAGFPTNSITRPIMLDNLYEWLEDVKAELVSDPELLSECHTFKKQRNGKFSADSGAHDDVVMKTAIACMMRATSTKGPTIVEII